MFLSAGICKVRMSGVCMRALFFHFKWGFPFYNFFIKMLGLNEKMFVIYLAFGKYSTNGIFLEQLNREFMY